MVLVICRDQLLINSRAEGEDAKLDVDLKNVSVAIHVV